MFLFFLFLASVVLSNAQFDLNPAHQLCQPCILAANAVKNTNKQSSVKEVEKKTCNTLLKNDLVCNGAVEVAGIYLNWTPAQTICENFQLCAPAADNKKMRAPVRGGKRPDELAIQVLQAFETDEFPVFPHSSRVARQAGVDLKEIEQFERLLREHSTEINEALQQFLEKFKNALQVYLDRQPLLH